ncbi:hypothetical protein HYDPIDRAFT_116296 [Hydnomerulius pinastri MD-312]|uniref:Uncharacterized protein n=1 Tax=Hydnomerulius pinastri MD-312 TaxID=994086 RepID=A0A0C9WC02_9AGAM|nr:hypothetical protein HYDPIDRAFT_116296 [Hydnomerulius pinastri MD-312]
MMHPDTTKLFLPALCLLAGIVVVYTVTKPGSSPLSLIRAVTGKGSKVPEKPPEGPTDSACDESERT